jgi:hypothetical protein
VIEKNPFTSNKKKQSTIDDNGTCNHGVYDSTYSS